MRAPDCAERGGHSAGVSSDTASHSLLGTASPATHRRNRRTIAGWCCREAFTIIASQRIRRSFKRHRERGRDRARHAVDIVRIDQQRGVEFVGGAGEFRQHQHAGIGRVLRRDIFLGDEVHAVMQRRDHADLRGAVEAGQHGLAIALVEIADRRPVDLAVAAVDVADELGEVALQIAIGLDRAARGRCDLQQRDRARQRGCWSTSGRTR